MAPHITAYVISLLFCPKVELKKWKDTLSSPSALFPPFTDCPQNKNYKPFSLRMQFLAKKFIRMGAAQCPNQLCQTQSVMKMQASPYCDNEAVD